MIYDPFMEPARQIAIHAGFMKDFQSLQPEVRRQVAASVLKFRINDLPGSHVEKIHNASNPRFRSVRVTQSIRAVVLAPTSGQLYVLLKVLPHDDAYKWAERTRLTVSGSRTFGLLDLEALNEVTAKARALPDAPRLFAHISGEEFRSLGIGDEVIELARELRSVDQIDEAKAAVPAEQWDILHALAAGLTLQEVSDELSIVPAEPEPANATLDLDTVDDADVDFAIANTRDQVYTVSGADDLEQMLDGNFAEWRVYLHPTQQRFIDAEYAGPARITGGPGTGKTVVAMHRAKRLAEQNDGSILLTTYNGALVMEINEALNRLIADEEVRSRIEVTTIDKVARTIVEERHGSKLLPASSPAEERKRNTDRPVFFSNNRVIWREIVQRHRLSYSAEFLDNEWNLVILPQEIKTEEQYLSAKRRGRGQGLNAAQRKIIWPAISDYRNTLFENGWWTFDTVVYAAASYERTYAVRGPYRHIVVDESQDLSVGHWRLIRALMLPNVPNNLFISGDTGQQIYNHGGSMISVDIDIQGRSRRLTLNHRSSVEILTLAKSILHDSESSEDDGRAARAIFHRRKPIASAFTTDVDELDHIAETIQLWHQVDDIAYPDIAVGVRTVKRIAGFCAALEKRGVPTRRLSNMRKDPRRAGVSVGSMHSLKGLEFRCVVVTGVGLDQVPPAGSITPAGVDPVTHAADLARERQLLYVACTRAREELLVTWVGNPSPLLPRSFTGPRH